MPWIRRRHFQIFLLLLGGILLLAVVLMVSVNLWVLSVTRERIHHDVAQCPEERVAIVFGTSRWTRGGGRNPHFEGRMQAAAALAKSGKVEHLLLSGDNSTRYYNEPIVMWRDLRGRDVPDTLLTLDYAGFSTFDTLARAKQVFGVEDALLVTQSWHLPRALFIADAMGIGAEGCAAPEDGLQRSALELRAREWLARVATVGDLYIWQRQPRFLGPKELIDIPLVSDDALVDEASADTD
ncbi:SanA/YdcF family protein [Halomonas halocynthiae]|uniref:SanA/YdcF family protein n=1 Tax=Halomonas halocynthiae TaxID=176290 RepID=UPI001F0B4184|nr:ElyC/SanA/YdcF family protein [Halomonas halocynthiae]